MRDNIILKCTECGEENYINTKNKRNHPDRMEVNKYCPRCNKKTVTQRKKISLGLFFIGEYFMERLIIKKFVLGIMSTNCYLIENNNHSILIDPGDKAELLINYLTQNNLQLTAILLTHGHFDHIGAIDD